MGKRAEAVTRSLRDLILTGVYQPGERLKEDVVAERLDASRTPVRLALMRLEVEGLVTYAMNRGFRVRCYTAADIAAAVRVRAALEGLACRIIAERGAAPATLADLNECLARIDHLLARDGDGGGLNGPLPDLIERYHATIVAASANARLIEEVGRMMLVPIRIGERHRWVSQERAAASVNRRAEPLAQLDRRRVVDAVVRREGPRAELLMREHLFAVHETLQRLVSGRTERWPDLREVG